MASTTTKNRLLAEKLAGELEIIMDEHFLSPPNDTVQANVKRIIAQIRSLGFDVKVKFNVYAGTISLKTTITLVPLK